ncbi:MAG: histone-like protein [Promethearchaeota archaeon]
MAKKKAPAKKKAAGKARSAYIAKAPIRRLMKNEGAGLVAEDAVILLIEELTKAAKEVTKEAVKLVKGDKRKRVTAADIAACE